MVFRLGDTYDRLGLGIRGDKWVTNQGNGCLEPAVDIGRQTAGA